ncbi:uncharacterized protein BBA_10230 [Beauveria bassiana ARSEF 2860]|uniref:DASH complex subunit ASK1 n=1 Tax=Beauveria bassiana (strain ARSEF 2860) TaxID=655819 RepID=J4UEU7_BEAB2|nr:uncharacterized protein BBA_10230 [Beauveria bassiana ARSEF 2860]EJP60827.1 hypothetical protein BBA_10230 [Beauveria bassiana ARSEF 2860]
MRGTTPVTTCPFLPSSSPVRRSTSAARNGRGQRRHIEKDINSNANYYGILANEEDETVDAFDAIDLESETQKIIEKEKERMTTRADVLRTFAESIAACARNFDHGYAHTVGNDFTKSLLRHWNQFLHSGEIVGSSGELSQPNLQTTRKPAAGPPTNDQASRRKTVSFADVTKAAAQQIPGDIRIAPTRRQPVAARNYADRRILLRLKEGSASLRKSASRFDWRSKKNSHSTPETSMTSNPLTQAGRFQRATKRPRKGSLNRKVNHCPNDQEPANEGENATEDVDEGEGTEEEGEDENDDNEDEDEDEDDNDIADEREDTRQSHQHEEQATSNSKKDPLLATSRGTGASVTKGLRREIIPKRNPITLKKRYISTHMAQQIIPSGTTNPSSDPPTGDVKP